MPQKHGNETVGVVYNWLDVTESVQAEAMRNRVLAAESATRAQIAFMSRASHELRTPLNAVLGFSQLLQGHPKVVDDAQVKRQVDYIRTAGEHLLALMDDLLQISQLEAGSMKLHVEPLDLGAMLRDTLALMHPQARLRDIVLIEPAPARAWVQGDVTRVRQVLMNLLSNAIKYNVPGGLVRLTLAEQPGRWLLDIADDGPGITAEQTLHLFEPFNRLGAERSGVEGTGLGLVIARQLMLAMNGTIALRSTPGAGSVFTLAWPSAAPAAA
jgi:signal transduction histidine kinase